MGVLWNDVNAKASGGTELQLRRLEERIDPALLDEVQVIPARGGADSSKFDPTKVRILWCQDLADDPMTEYLANEGWRVFHRIVFVSHSQQLSFIQKYNIPWSRCVVLHNAIDPIPFVPKPQADPTRIVYTPTPHRGLDVLYAAFDQLSKEKEVVLDVYSSFKLYGWPEMDERFKDLIKLCEDHPKINYHGTVPNEELRTALQSSHVFAYPSTWIETSCVCLMEAMSADLICVHSNLGALPETAANWTMMYPTQEDKGIHAQVHYQMLKEAVERSVTWRQDTPSSQKMYADAFYGWELRKLQWESLIRSMLHLPREIEQPTPQDTFNYRIG